MGWGARSPYPAPIGGNGLGAWYCDRAHGKHTEPPHGASAWGNVCLARTRRATFVISILSLAPSISSPREVPQQTALDRTPSLQSTLHKPKYEN